MSIHLCFVSKLICVFVFSTPNSSRCQCEICNCTCTARFRRDQLQSIHHAKKYDLYQKQQASKKSEPKASVAAADTHSIIRDLTSTIVTTSTDSMLRVLQNFSPSKHQSGTKFDSTDNVSMHRDQYVCHGQYDPRELQVALERSLGVTAHTLAQNQQLSSNIQFKNELRTALGGIPSTHLVAENETVAQTRHRRRFQNSKERCSRTSRNNLMDLTESDDDQLLKPEVQKKKIQIIKKLLKMLKDEDDETGKNKIKYCIKALDDKNEGVQNDMIDFTFEVYTRPTELESFDSMDAAMNILEFAEDNEKES